MRSMVEGFSPTPRRPSTSLRLVPLPCQCRGGICQARGPSGSFCFTSSISAHGSERWRRSSAGTVATV